MSGELLGSLDPFEFQNVEKLRSKIVSIIEDHFSQFGSISRFELVRSHIIESELGLEVQTLQEFRDALTQVEVGAIYN